MGANAQTSVPTFTAGDILTAANMNISARTGIPVFADSTARDAAFGGTGEKTLAEGQFAYLESTNATQYYDGSTWQAVASDPAWQSYTPTWGSTGTTPSLGNGTLVGKYVQQGKLVTFRAVLTLGSTSTIGTGQYNLSLPVEATPGGGSGGNIATVNGTGWVIDASAGGYYFVRADILDSTTSVRFRLLNASATYATLGTVAENTPFTFATSDTINISGTYEAN